MESSHITVQLNLPTSNSVAQECTPKMLIFSSAARKQEVSPVGYLLFPRPKEAKRHLLQPENTAHCAHLYPGMASAKPDKLDDGWPESERKDI